MKKTITIGRGNDSHIILSDERTSRRHCLLTIYPTGSMEIKDLSQNGTYVNGMKIPRNANFKVKRDDVVTFAQAEKLNWQAVEDPYKNARLAVIGCTAVILLFFAFVLCKDMIFPQNNFETLGEGGSSTQTETKKDVKKDTKKEDETNCDTKGNFNITPSFPTENTHPTTEKPGRRPSQKQEDTKSVKETPSAEKENNSTESQNDKTPETVL